MTLQLFLFSNFNLLLNDFKICKPYNSYESSNKKSFSPRCPVFLKVGPLEVYERIFLCRSTGI